MITREAAETIIYDHCQNLIESLSNVHLEDINLYASKLRIYEGLLDDDQKAILYEAEQVLDDLTA